MGLFATICSFYYVVVLYAFDTVFPGMASSSFKDFMNNLSTMSLGPELRPIMVIVTSAFDLVWLAFVGALVCRHTAYMIVNITTYEVLVRPGHVQRRFPKSKGRFWFLQGCGPISCIRHCINYWTLNTESDAADFGAAPQDSFVAPPDSGIKEVYDSGNGVDGGDVTMNSAASGYYGNGNYPMYQGVGNVVHPAHNDIAGMRPGDAG